MKEKILKTLAKGKSEKAREYDRQEMLALFHQEDEEFELKNILLNELNNSDSDQVSATLINKLFVKLWSKIEKNNKTSHSKVGVLYYVVRIAAVLIIAVLLGVFINSYRNTSDPAIYYSKAPSGSISEIILPDGSCVFLNSASEIKYVIDENNKIREVFLSGEAWFDVTKNEKKPFIVHTPFYDVKVTGTKFNVKAYGSDNESATTLEEGRVIIQSNSYARITEDIVLDPGEQMVMKKEAKVCSVQKVNTNWFTSWKDNKLIFVNMALKDLVVLLERKYGVDIEIKTPDILNLHFDGTLKNESIFEILEIITHTLPVKYNIKGQSIEISHK